MTPFWISAFVDLAPDVHPVGLAFWCDVTGWPPTPPRGGEGEFTTLVPPGGDGHLRVQRLESGRSRVHLDLHVAAPRVAADGAVALGAREIADVGYVVMASPGGFPFCLVTHPSSVPARATTWSEGHGSVVDQVCLDIPAELYDREVAFWRELTGREVAASTGHPEFRRLLRSGGQPLHVLLQQLDEPLGPVRGHLDLATTDRAAETRRHVALGAREVAAYDDWTVLTDPAGSAYCITDREPAR